MAFKYPCFISYCHPNGNLMGRFISEFTTALKDCLDAYFDEEVFLDKERLRPGYLYNEALAEAICQSVCMVVVYVPRYERHSYCLREYAAMESLESKRISLLRDRPGVVGAKFGLIIPIIFRGEDDIPPLIGNQRHYCSFSRFTTANPDVGLNYSKEIEEIAKYIHDLRKMFSGLEEEGEDPYSGCESFRLPTEKEVRPWRSGEKLGIVAPFPGRE
jgi:hypothetical protein